MTTLAGDLRTPNSTAVVEGTIALTATDQRTAGSKTLVTITYPIEVNASTYNETDIPAGEYEVQERLESDGMWGTESVYRVIVPESGTWSLRALREMYDGPPDPDPDLFLTVPVADATYASQSIVASKADAWVASTAYATGAPVLLPNGRPGTRTAAGTSRPAFDATEEALWTVAPVLPTGGTSGQVPIKGSGTTVTWGTPTSTDTLARKRNVTAQRRALPGIVEKFALPAGFNWLDAPIRIFKDGARYVTDFDVAKFKNVSTKTIYMDHIVGVDTNDGLTEATPKKSIYGAMVTAADGDTVFILSKGIHHRISSVITNRIRKNVNIIAKYPGEFTFSYSDSLTYTQDVTNTSVYTATRSNVAKVIDLGVGDSGGFEYTKVTTIAECQALAGSWYQNGTTVGIHTFDGVIPNNNQHVALLAGELFYCDATTQNVSLYLEGFTILGGNNGNLTIDPQSTYWADVYCKNVDFFWATGLASAVVGNSVNIQGGRFAYFQNCRSAHSNKDGFNYTKFNVAQEEKSITRFIEVNCESWDHGIGNGGASNTHNASTAHAGCRGIRIGGSYHHTRGAIIADVQVDTKTVNYSIAAFDSLSATTDGYNSAFSLQQTGAEMWIYDGTLFGTSYDIFTNTTDQLHAIDTQFDTRLVNAAYDIVNAL